MRLLLPCINTLTTWLSSGRYALLFLLCGSAVLADAAEPTHPTIWQVQGKHNTLYLTGTIHVLPADEPLPSNVQRAYRQTTQLLMEIDMDDLDPFATQATMMQLGWLPESQTLNDLLDTKLRSQLNTAAADVGIDPSALQRLQPWLAALTLEQLKLAKLGLSGANGIEMQLTKLAAQDHKTIQGLESIDEQLQLFADLNDAQQREFLQQTLDELAQPDELQQLLTAWRIGDDQTMTRLLSEGFEDAPALLDAVTTQRNRRWLAQLQPILNDATDNYLVAVGAMHLVGDQGLVKLLQQAGYRVSRSE